MCPMTFLVSHNGTVYENDLGSDTPFLGAVMHEYNPGDMWKEVKS